MSHLTDRLHAQAAPQRAEYARLRLDGLDSYEAARQMDLSDGRRRMYEKWARSDHPELTAPVKPRPCREWWRTT